MAQPTSASSAYPFLAQLEQETLRNARRLANGLQLLSHPREPRVGQTPREAVHRTNKSVLYRYGAAPGRRRRPPVLMVPNLGISRPYIFDLAPGSSFIAHMVREGFDFYLLDWGVFGEEDNGLRVDDCVTRILPTMVRKALKASGAEQVSLLGYCMGGPLGACYAALHPEQVRNLINMAGPIDFQCGGLFTAWLDKRHFNVDRLVGTFGSMPADLVRLGFKLLRPTMDLSTGVNLWWNLWNEKYVDGFLALNKWANDYVPFPGEFFRQWVTDFYQENKLVQDRLVLGGQPVRLSAIRCPVLVVEAAQDYICPAACARALLDRVSSTEKAFLELPGGHISLIAGRGAARNVWPRVSDWLGERSE
jgi:polyhydroxyalkanoate synthase